MATTFTANGFYDQWMVDMGTEVHKMGSDTFIAKLYLQTDFKDRQAKILTDLTDPSNEANVTLTNPTWAAVGTTNVIKWDADDVTFTAVAAGEEITGCVLFNDTPTGPDPVDPLICCIFDVPFPITTTGNNIVIAFNASGIGTVTNS